MGKQLKTKKHYMELTGLALLCSWTIACTDGDMNINGQQDTSSEASNDTETGNEPILPMGTEEDTGSEMENVPDTDTDGVAESDSVAETDSVTEESVPIDMTIETGVIFAGGDHSCGLGEDSLLWCWGYNSNGQLGDGTTATSWIPGKATGGPSDVAQVSMGTIHTCVLTSAGAVSCFGNNQYGQLGVETACYLAKQDPCLSTTPIAVPGLGSGVVAITSGKTHNCALYSDGRVACWGDNSYGQLGDGLGGDDDVACTDCSSANPKIVENLDEGVVAITAGRYHTCAALASGGVKCWGWNVNGELGRGPACEGVSDCVLGFPDRVVNLDTEVATLTAGSSHTCAITTEGEMACWGENQYGALGVESSLLWYSSEPIYTSLPMDGIIEMSAGAQFTCALNAEGRVLCWGIDQNGQSGVASDTSLFHEIEGLESEVVAIASGERHTCAKLSSGAFKCWGSNKYGQLGNNAGGFPVKSQALPGDIVKIDMGSIDNCALSATGAVSCWGNETTEISTPWTEGVQDIAVGWNHTCALLETGEVSCFGDGTYSQMGVKVASQETPMIIAGLPDNITALAADETGTMALTADGDVYYWGFLQWHREMEYGDPIEQDPPAPATISGLDPVIAIDMGNAFPCVLTAPGEIYCLNSRLDFSSMTSVPSGSTRFQSFSVGDKHLCALDADGAAWCWGSNSHGQLGDGDLCSDIGCDPSFTSPTTPVAGLASGVSAIAGGSMHSCALTTEGDAWCWGNNYNGQVGGTVLDLHLNATKVPNVGSPLKALYAGRSHTCGITDVGDVMCWGEYGPGLGTGVLGYEPSPESVVSFTD